jgi:hypothetical protein
MVEIKNALSICLRFLSSILIIYCITIAWLIYGFTKNKIIELNATPTAIRTRFTIIVPFRNGGEPTSTFR